MLFIRRQYDAQERELHVRDDLVVEGPHREQRVVIPVNGINRAVDPGGHLRADDEPRHPGGLRHRRPRGGGGAARTLGAPDPGRAAGHRRVAVPGGHPARSSPTSTSSTRPGRRTRIRSPSSSCPSTWPATGGSDCSTTRPPSASRPPSSARPHRHRRRAVPTEALTTGASPARGRRVAIDRSPMIGGRRPLKRP